MPSDCQGNRGQRDLANCQDALWWSRHYGDTEECAGADQPAHPPLPDNDDSLTNSVDAANETE